MKKYRLFSAMLVAAFLLPACDDFLDTVPDNRAEINSADKVTKLLVSAYPQAFPLVMWEMASDNIVDNGAKYDFTDQVIQDAYLWKDVRASVHSDAPQGLWDNLYSAIAASNHALQAIEAMGNPKGMNPQRGEALICRAYAHFILVNTFCVAYNPQTAAKELGIPYATEPETTVAPHYERGTLEETYRQIEEDIQAALPLIDDNIYTVPKYHFNQKAAYAFASRFYLFYVKGDKSNYEKVLEYGEKVLGVDPSLMLRSYQTDLGAFSDFENRADAFIADKVKTNLLITPVYSSWPYIYGPYSMDKRYGMNRDIVTAETLWADGPWGGASGLFYASLNGSEQKMSFFKYRMYFEYTDKVNGIGYRHAVIVPFTADETLMCCAEALVMKAQPDYPKAVEYINMWIKSHEGSGEYGRPDMVTENGIVDFFEGIKETPVPVISKNQRTIKKRLNPIFPFGDKKQENFIHCILQMRRIELIHDGLRWLDIKRYGIEISHDRDSMEPVVLTKDDPRRAMQLPQDVINAGLQANPR